MPSGFRAGEIDLTSAQWRQKKRAMVEACKGCLYSCYFQCENPDYKSDLRTLMNMILIKSGNAGLVRRLGESAVGKTSEIIPVPQSELEKFQAEIKDYYKLHNKIKRRGLDLISTLATPFVYTFAAAVLGLIYLQARRKGISSDEVSRALLASMVYPGLLDNGEEKKSN